MIRGFVPFSLVADRWPRTSGDDPMTSTQDEARGLLAPHERG